jgi:hypothetical protein
VYEASDDEPVELGRRRLWVEPTEKRVLGLPLTWFSHAPLDWSGARHPVRWIEWRISRHRNGPYTPAFKEFAERARKI